MIGYLKGNVIIINKDNIVLDVNNVGYRILTPMPYEYILNNEYQFYVYTHVREDQISLFGFKSNDQKDVFLQLISVKGVGPKTGLGILSSIDHNELVQAIEANDINFLKKMPGIGPKSAAQIVLDLQGKLIVDTTNTNHDLKEALEALEALGYKNAEIKKVEKGLSNQKLSTEEYIKEGLQLLLK
ncbi:MAG: Holliday junction branch migration protein RuvA [Erysipelotrichales bacterium]